MKKYQLMCDDKAIADITFWDALVLQGTLEGLKADKHSTLLSIASGRWEIQEYQTQENSEC
jgi:hypothetical protein